MSEVEFKVGMKLRIKELGEGISDGVIGQIHEVVEIDSDGDAILRLNGNTWIVCEDWIGQYWEIVEDKESFFKVGQKYKLMKEYTHISDLKMGEIYEVERVTPASEMILDSGYLKGVRLDCSENGQFYIIPSEVKNGYFELVEEEDTREEDPPHPYESPFTRAPLLMNCRSILTPLISVPVLGGFVKSNETDKLYRILQEKKLHNPVFSINTTVYGLFAEGNDPSDMCNPDFLMWVADETLRDDYKKTNIKEL